MTSKLLVVTTAENNNQALQNANKFIKGYQSFFYDYSIIKTVSEDDEEFENIGANQINFEENSDEWFDEYSKLNSPSLEFEDWITSKKYLLRDVNTFSDIQNLAKEIAAQYLNYGDIFEYLKQFDYNNRTVEKPYSVDSLSVNNINEDDFYTVDIDYQHCKEYFSVMQAIEENGTLNPDEFDILEHSYFPGHFGDNQIAHYNYEKKDKRKKSLNKTWVVMADILW